MGSGGVLAEALLHGNNSIGIDVNPFVVLISRVKTLSILGGRLKKRFSEIITKARSDYDSGIQYDTSLRYAIFTRFKSVGIRQIKENYN